MLLLPEGAKCQSRDGGRRLLQRLIPLSRHGVYIYMSKHKDSERLLRMLVRETFGELGFACHILAPQSPPHQFVSCPWVHDNSIESTWVQKFVQRRHDHQVRGRKLLMTCIYSSDYRICGNACASTPLGHLPMSQQHCPYRRQEEVPRPCP